MRPVFLLTGLLTACCAAAPDPVLPPRVEAPPPAQTIKPPSPAVSVAVVKKFDEAKAREISVVLGPDITEDQLADIRIADRWARRALTALGLQGHKVTAPVLAEARQAVHALEAALAKP